MTTAVTALELLGDSLLVGLENCTRCKFRLLAIVTLNVEVIRPLPVARCPLSVVRFPVAGRWPDTLTSHVARRRIISFYHGLHSFLGAHGSVGFVGDKAPRTLWTMWTMCGPTASAGDPMEPCHHGVIVLNL